ncbi:MAG: hypothetical protein H0W73_00815 [Bacteroidetes bacterium]|nr:hypothetical protein [Bacteroidota bacterium]
MRIYGGIIILFAFICWVFYRLFIKKDLRQNLQALGVYSSFVLVWAIIYAFIIY